ncbi:MAG TPA: preprotein translocase subunit SecG [Candidatus Kapabacteria bacterium]|nr:preprotein translocase subunit SecG [Candidatus Kapabacteria bacterium]
MFTFLILLMMVISVLLTAVVLIQPGKGDMITGMAGLTNTFSSMLGSRKAMDMLTKLTIGLAALLLVLSLATNKFFLPTAGGFAVKPITEGVAVPQTVPTQPVQQLPAQKPAEQKGASEGQTQQQK